MPPGTPPVCSQQLIALTLSRREPYFAITCVNSRTGGLVQTEGRLQFAQEEDGHGYGLWVAQRETEVY